MRIAQFCMHSQQYALERIRVVFAKERILLALEPTRLPDILRAHDCCMQCFLVAEPVDWSG